MKRGIRFIYLFRHFNLTPVRNLDCTSSLQPAPVLLHLPVCIGSLKMLKKPFSLICLLLLHLKDLSFIFIHLDFGEISPFLNRTMAPMALGQQPL